MTQLCSKILEKVSVTRFMPNKKLNWGDMKEQILFGEKSKTAAVLSEIKKGSDLGKKKNFWFFGRNFGGVG